MNEKEITAYSAETEEEIILVLRRWNLKLEEIEELLSKKIVKEKKSLLIRILSHKRATPSLFLQHAKFLYPSELVMLSKQPTINVFVKNEVLRYLAMLYEKMGAGERKSILRRVPPEFFRYFKEKDGNVLSSILENPRLTETKLIEIITQMKPDQAFIERVLKSGRWKNRKRVIFSLFTLPYFPDYEAVKRLKFLSPSDLNFIIKNPLISENIKREAKRELNKIKKAGY